MTPSRTPRRPRPTRAPRSPEIAPLAPFVGTWRLEGRGSYPTIAGFVYGEEISLRDVGRPFLLYEQRTWALDDGRPLHAEAGYWRPKPDGRINIHVAQATGMVEVDEGTIDAGRVRVASRAVGSASTGPDVTSVERGARGLRRHDPLRAADGGGRPAVARPSRCHAPPRGAGAMTGSPRSP